MDYFAYDIPGIRNPKDDQMGLQLKYWISGSWSICFCYSYKLNYLKKKMIENYKWQKEYYKENIGDLYYRVVDKKENVYFEYAYLN